MTKFHVFLQWDRDSCVSCSLARTFPLFSSVLSYCYYSEYYFFLRLVIAVELPLPSCRLCHILDSLGFSFSCLVGFVTFLVFFCSLGGYPAASLLFLSIASENERGSCVLRVRITFSPPFCSWQLSGCLSLGLAAQRHHPAPSAQGSESLYAGGDIDLGM